MKEDKEVEALSAQLGFNHPLFLDKDFVLLHTNSKKEILDAVHKSKGKSLFYRAVDEETTRFVLEKTPIKLIFGLENLNPKDSLHYVRGGLDQVLCKIAAEKGKIIAFSLADLLKAENRGQMLARMMFNIQLCQKYKVKMYFGTFATGKMELRSTQDLEAVWRVLGGKGKEALQLK